MLGDVISGLFPGVLVKIDNFENSSKTVEKYSLDYTVVFQSTSGCFKTHFLN